jgi:hypothetical protein
MKRREFIAGISASVWPLAARVQRAIPVIGYLSAGSTGSANDGLSLPPFLQGLNGQRGWPGVLRGERLVRHRRAEGHSG